MVAQRYARMARLEGFKGPAATGSKGGIREGVGMKASATRRLARCRHNIEAALREPELTHRLLRTG